MSDNCLNDYDGIVDKFTSWANTSYDVKSAFIIGSRAREDHPADEYSDLDIFMVVTDPEYFLLTNQWIENIGTYWISFSENTVGGGKERRVLFESALDVDFILLPEQGITQVMESSDVQSLFVRGFKVLTDKIGLAGTLPHVSTERKFYAPISKSEFLNLTNDFWFHSVWTAKKLLRGELWAAKSCVDCYMKKHMLRMIECHAHVKNGWDYDTWHNGRFLDTWTEQRVKEGLQRAFALYSRDDVGRALLATMDLFRLLAAETADRMDFEYPVDADKMATEWVRKSLCY